ncbi:uncharacterized protein LOC124809577 [Hydra vulgaris]|uniref:uncharacterized protein LOC124809577 n=2 Tax=Hydra vulgaris TaxID=6087 RepID=UPI001F5FBCFF|nr:uncharacterized protein LOC124816637 [Hydra vulgaris]
MLLFSALDAAEQNCAADNDDEEYSKDLEVLKQLRVEEDEIALKELQARKESIKKKIAKRKAILGGAEKMLVADVAEPSKDIEIKNLTRQDFHEYRLAHPGPKSKAAYRVWAQNGADRPDFKPYSRRGRGRGRGGSTVVNHFKYSF